jgi:glutaredoxin
MNFRVYSKPSCKACEDAKELLASNFIPFEEMIIDIGQPKDPQKSYVSVKSLKDTVPTAQTVPQILNGDELVGGLEALKRYLNK